MLFFLWTQGHGSSQADKVHVAATYYGLTGRVCEKKEAAILNFKVDNTHLFKNIYIYGSDFMRVINLREVLVDYNILLS